MDRLIGIRRVAMIGAIAGSSSATSLEVRGTGGVLVWWPSVQGGDVSVPANLKRWESLRLEGVPWCGSEHWNRGRVVA
jgi:hypothetical protein